MAEIADTLAERRLEGDRSLEEIESEAEREGLQAHFEEVWPDLDEKTRSAIRLMARKDAVVAKVKADFAMSDLHHLLCSTNCSPPPVRLLLVYDAMREKFGMSLIRDECLI